ncbi:nucleotidyltransferase domain-containing protein [bacterium]|nr:nucleotidyltransferase domain-containing protein [bacterium]
MHDYIRSMISEVERQHGVKVLYACESGSRAWGFASPDSDYDLRFVYLAPLDWHLSLQQQADTIEFFADNELDLAGWELAKTLRLFHSCNLAFNEWLDSPVVYHDDGSLAGQLRDLVPQYFNPQKAFHHYRSTALRKLGESLPADPRGIKSLFYIIRPLCACQWVLEHGSMPPTAFAALRSGISLPDAVAAAIDELLEHKLRAAEQQPVSPPAELAIWIGDSMNDAQGRAAGLAVNASKSWEPLNLILRNYLRQS